MKIEAMRTKTVIDLNKESANQRAKLATLRKDLQVNDVKENSQIRKVRKDIARLETLITQKELAIAEGEKS